MNPNNHLPTINIFKKNIPKLGIGTWGIGGYMTKSPYSDYVNEITQIKYQLSKGLSLVDCWIAQGEGGSLELIRQAIEDFDREKITLLCKFDIHKYKDIVELETVFNKYLKQLNTDYIDVFQIHKPVFTNISERELNIFLMEKIKHGKVGSFAVSNAKKEDLINLKKKIDIPVEANEILYNIFDREYEVNGTIEYCNKNNIKILAYRPLNRGMTNIAHTSPSFAEIVNRYTLTPNQIALNWLLQKENVLALVKSSNRAHINENMDCMSITLTLKDLNDLDSWRM
ncbi:MAG: Aldo/keto reductase [candidate division WS6 bacterium GW2011_GWF2_39_15]|uniref:Aldo/keto reductase n=1 Tax=candidate division WS6 bacterium GW2011_GWF2_39_15 TaxID=1619100 RepID=A0A0G0Q5V6_9BACT|nr:MAG: Aldo/keto reductase [candidate division WS6 bacterium GW2011_GWF2_39_15]